MPAVGHGLAIAVYLAIGVAIGVGWVPLPPWAVDWAMPIGVAASLGLGLAHAQLIAARSRRALERRLYALAAAQAEGARALAAAQKQLAAITANADSHRERDESQRTELKELYALLRGVADVARPASDTPADNPLPASDTPYGRDGGRGRSMRLPTLPKLAPIPAPAPSLTMPAAPTVAAAVPVHGGAQAAAAVAESARPEFDETVALIRDAIADRRLEMFLQPVMRLPQRRPAMFEVLCRLRDPQGNLVLPSRFLEVAEESGLIVDLDNALLFRCLEEVRRNLEAGTDVTYQVNLSPQTLADRRFFPQIVACLTANPQVRDSLILEMREADVASLADAGWRQLDRLATAGFRFSLDHIASLPVDPAKLVDSHFRLIKIDAAALFPTVGAAPAVDLHGFLEQCARVGMTVIVEKIETEPMLLNLLDYDIDLGQGYLFGRPRRTR